MTATQRQHRLRWPAKVSSALCAGAVIATTLSIVPSSASAQEAGPVGRPFELVLEQVVDGDLILAGNSNVLAAGGWRTAAGTAADVDGESTPMCLRRRSERPTLLDVFELDRLVCADNSSSADLALPTGARVITARLYVQTSLSADVEPLRVSLDVPGGDVGPQLLPDLPPAERAEPVGTTTTTTTTTTTPTPTTPTTTTPSTTTTTTPSTTTTTTPTAPTPPTAVAATPVKLYEAVGDGAVMRQAVWDVTEQVQAAGAGTYTVADIVHERAGPWLPFASWGLVVAYELDPAVGLDTIADADRHRFAPRFVSWHDGFQHLSAGSLDVTVGDSTPVPPRATFAKSFHIVAHGRGGRSDNLLVDGEPIGNNHTPGDTPPPPGVTLGTDPACNSMTDVQNDSICVLGTPVATKSPGALDYRASRNGLSSSSGSGVDMDVVRIPGRILRVTGDTVVVSIQLTGGDAPAPGLLAVSIDVAGTPS